MIAPTILVANCYECPGHLSSTRTESPCLPRALWNEEEVGRVFSEWVSDPLSSIFSLSYLSLCDCGGDAKQPVWKMSSQIKSKLRDFYVQAQLSDPCPVAGNWASESFWCCHDNYARLAGVHEAFITPDGTRRKAESSGIWKKTGRYSGQSGCG
jgi:hypothetical protein